MRAFVAPALVALVSLSANAWADDAEFAARASRSVVRLFAADGHQASETGVVISADGHVVANDSWDGSVTAILSDGRRYVATRVAGDGYGNLAVFRLPVSQEPPRPGNPDDVRDGDAVFAVIAASDETWRTAKARVLNARRKTSGQRYPSLPYIDIEDNESAPIRGPVFDQRGGLIGFVTLRSGSGAPRVFAMPIGDVLRIADQLRASGQVSRSRIGIVTKVMSKPGALIDQVVKGSPADRAGLKAGEIILKAGTTTIEDPLDYSIAMERTRAGSPITLEVLGTSGPRQVSLATGQLVPRPDDTANPWSLPESSSTSFAPAIPLPLLITPHPR